MELDRRYTSILKDYDRDLYAVRRYGRIDVMKKSYKLVAYEFDGDTLLVPHREDWYVFSLTHNWKSDGEPVQWGRDPLLKHLADGDTHRRNVIGDFLKGKEREEAAMERRLDNQLEAFWKDNRRAWAKNFDQVNRSNLKPKDRRYEDDKKRKMKGL